MKGLRMIVMAAAAVAGIASANAANCTKQGTDVTCDDGRRGVWTGDSIIWADGTRVSAVTQHPSVIIGNKASVHIGPGVFAGNGKGGHVPMEDPQTQHCAILDGVSYCE
ncbi:MAG: hypothetical protein JOY90_14110 [Bradyrhizobium sp.]|uniref:hypothetical protein n=1 Tax=Bradyrhizobium sp. TaxID=376 RepID=UPI001DD7AE07|nr:hypothetical protein [Bradyrhizobium sp.]MBV9561563.1 hypothetical protein [Bradyrhizobium sp.]